MPPSRNQLGRRLKRLTRRLRSGKLDDPVRSKGKHHRASHLVDHDPPRGWNYMAGCNWSQKWLISVSLGPWRGDQTQGVIDRVLDHFGRRRLSSLRRSHRLPFPKLARDWQWQWTLRLAQ